MGSVNSTRDFSFVMVGRIVSAGLQALFYLIFAALLQPEAYGQLSYLIAIAGTVSTVSRFGLNHTVTVYQAKGETRMSSQVNSLAIITTTAASLLLLLVDPNVALLCFSMSLFLMNIHNLTGLKKYKKYMGIDITKGILIVTLPIALYFVFEIPGILLGSSISYLVCSPHFFKFLQFKNSFDVIKNNYKVLAHNFGVDMSTNATRFVDKLLIVPIMGFAYTGIYQLNLQILSGLEMLPLALHSFLLSEESSGKSQKKISAVVVAASIAISAVVIVLAPFVIGKLFPQYQEGTYSFQILVVSIIPLTVGAILTAKLQAIGSTRVGFLAAVRIGSLLILLAILGNTFGLTGLSMAVLASSILSTAFLYILYLKNKVPKQ
ncbi:MAG: oligosaccharide flippase family protein [Candidatus Nitrosotenuis sp.]